MCFLFMAQLISMPADVSKVATTSFFGNAHSWANCFGMSSYLVYIVGRTHSWNLFFIAKASVLVALKEALKTGYLEIEDSTDHHSFGTSSDFGCGHTVHLKVLNDSFWTRVLVWDYSPVGIVYFASDIICPALEISDVSRDIMGFWQKIGYWQSPIPE